MPSSLKLYPSVAGDKLGQLFTEGYTHEQLAHWLANQGLIVTLRTLKQDSLNNNPATIS
jgi:hypothetical protein